MSTDYQSIRPQMTSSYFNKYYSIPKKCPHCEVVIYPRTIDAAKTSYDQTFDLNFLLHSCTSCNKNYLTTHLQDRSKNTMNFLSIYPELKLEPIPALIEDFSPRFARVYGQALVAESLNHIELAATGCRMALEILAKEFAISENDDDDEKIRKMSLNKCLHDYFSEVPLSVSGHVVRMLGNDYVHYIQKHPEVEFEEIKHYMNIFLLNIEMKLRIKNPPIPTPAHPVEP